jgi:hypothetical protein
MATGEKVVNRRCHGSFILGSLDDVMALTPFVVTIFLSPNCSLLHSDRNFEFCLQGKAYPIGLLLAGQGSGFI